MNAPASKPIHAMMAVALTHAANGLRVFPVKPNAKIPPLIEEWQTLATVDRNQIAAWWAQWPDANVGICTTGLCVVDVDVKKGGNEAFAALIEEIKLLGEPMPSTWASRTTTGGSHLYFKLPAGELVPNSVERLGSGIDVRGVNGYAVAPGSVIGDKSYEWKTDYAPGKLPLTTAPAWLIERCGKPTERGELAGVRVVAADEIAEARADEYLRHSAPEAVQGGRDFEAYRLAARLFDEGISFGSCLERMLDWNETHCHPPLDRDVVEDKVRSGMKNRNKPIGAKHPDAPGFDEHTIEPKQTETHTRRERFEVIRADEGARRAKANAHLDPLIKGVIDRGVTSVLIGAPGGGKTFLVLDMAYHVAAGKEWGGRRVQQGAVVYLALEAGKLILRRFAAIELKYGPLDGIPLFTIPAPADLAHGTADADALIRVIRKTETESKHKIELVVIDTLARAISGGDENSSKDMGAVIQASDRIRDAIKCHVMLIHHPGKDETRGGRGSSNVFGAVETEMTVTNKVLKFTKQRDMEKGEPIRFTLKQVKIGTDEEGAPITSCTVALADKGEAGERVPLTGAEQALMDGIAAELEKAMLPLDSPFDLHLARCAVRKSDSERLPAKSTVSEHVRSCSEKGWLEKRNNGQWVMLRSEAFGNVRN